MSHTLSPWFKDRDFWGDGGQVAITRSRLPNQQTGPQRKTSEDCTLRETIKILFRLVPACAHHVMGNREQRR